jgi:hypothetical protein
MLVKPEQLKQGDEIIIATNSQLRYVRLLRDPMIRQGSTHWITKEPLYKAVKCSMRMDEHKVNNWKYKVYTPTPNDHNFERFVNLNDRSIWLVKTGDGRIVHEL